MCVTYVAHTQSGGVPHSGISVVLQINYLIDTSDYGNWIIDIEEENVFSVDLSHLKDSLHKVSICTDPGKNK